MSEDMITKKDLLKETDISYGQLYRWKRKNLIPEEWFIKKSAFTGQETYFPREKILNRIAQIKDMKDTLSLDEMAAIFSGALHNEKGSGEESKAVGFLNVELTGRELVSKDVISDIILNILGDLTRTEYAVTYSKNYTFEEIMYMYIAYKCISNGTAGIHEVKLLLETFINSKTEITQGMHNVILIRKMGVPMWVIFTEGSEVIFDKESNIVVNISTTDIIEELKSKMVKK